MAFLHHISGPGLVWFASKGSPGAGHHESSVEEEELPRG